MSSPSTSELAEMLELTARMLHSRGYAAALFPAQWTALRYFSRAPMDQRTASELARFQGLANGPVSRTVRTLVQKGLLARAADQPGGRAALLEVTSTGHTMLEQDPTRALEDAIGDLAPSEQACFARSMELILKRLTAARQAQ